MTREKIAELVERLNRAAQSAEWGTVVLGVDETLQAASALSLLTEETRDQIDSQWLDIVAELKSKHAEALSALTEENGRLREALADIAGGYPSRFQDALKANNHFAAACELQAVARAALALTVEREGGEEGSSARDLSLAASGSDPFRPGKSGAAA